MREAQDRSHRKLVTPEPVRAEREKREAEAQKTTSLSGTRRRTRYLRMT